MGTRVTLALTLLGVTCPFFWCQDAGAQDTTGRLLEGLRIEEGPEGVEIHIGFTHPVRYLRHAPHEPAEAVDVQLAAAGTGAWPFLVGSAEALQPPRGSRAPLELVRVEVASGEATVEVRFVRRVAFEVSPGRDMRSVVVRLPVEGPPTPDPAATPQLDELPPPDPRATELMEEGRRAFTAAEYERASLIFGEVARMPESSVTPEARELLGLSRERRGQLAHAKAEYEAYLRHYPQGPAADRVRQRLAAITTARVAPSGPLRIRPESRPGLEIETFGSLYAGFRRESLFSGGEEFVVDNSLLTDVHLDARLNRRGRTLRSQLSASYWHGFFDRGSEGQARLYSAFLESGNATRGLAWSLGRRTASTRGVIGRYDGAQLSYGLGERWEVGAIAGLPVWTSRIDGFDANRYLAGANLAVRGLAEVVDTNLFLIGQMADGTVDRAAVGGELRYFQDGRMLAAFLDFDLYFLSLNVAQLIGNWQIDPRAFVSATLDYRNVPILTTSNALIGQPEQDLGGLLDALSQSDVKQLAEDRTGWAGSLTLNGSYALTTSLQLAGDFVVSHLSGTESSGGVAGWSGTGVEFTYGARLIANDLLAAGDVNVFSLRFFDGSNTDVIAATFDARYPLTRNIRLNPRLLADFRMAGLGSDMVRVIPSLRGDWRIFGFRLESELGFEWLETISGIGGRQLGYFVMLGARYDF